MPKKKAVAELLDGLYNPTPAAKKKKKKKKNATPKKNAPKKTISKKNAPKKTISKKTAPKKTTPKETKSKKKNNKPGPKVGSKKPAGFTTKKSHNNLKLDSNYKNDDVKFKVLPEHIEFYSGIVSNGIDDRSYLDHVLNAMATINENRGCSREQIMNYINDKYSEDKEETNYKKGDMNDGWTNTRYKLSDKMAEFMRKDSSSAAEVQRAVWDYTNTNCKHSEVEGFTLDETMRSLLGESTVSFKTMNSLIIPHFKEKLGEERSKEDIKKRNRERRKEVKEGASKAKWGVLNAKIDTAIQHAVDYELCTVRIVESAISRESGSNRKRPPEELGARCTPQVGGGIQDQTAESLVTIMEKEGNVNMAKAYASLDEATKRADEPSGQLASIEELQKITEETKEGETQTHTEV